MSETETIKLLSTEDFLKFQNVRVCGLMAMATFTDVMNLVRNEFRNLAVFFQRVKRKFFSEKDYFYELSMGLSADYKVAIEEVATMIRIGSLIFGER